MDNKPVLFFFFLMFIALALIVTYQITTSPVNTTHTHQMVQTQAAADPHQADPGLQLYGQNCARCHGPIGEGKDFNPSLYDKNLTLKQIKTIIRTGRGKMPAFSKLTDQEVELIARFVQAL